VKITEIASVVSEITDVDREINDVVLEITSVNHRDKYCGSRDNKWKF